MRVLILCLQKEQDLKTAASLLLEIGLFSTAILDGEGLENIGVPQEQLFSSFQNLFGQGSAYNRTLISPVRNLETVELFVHLCKKEGIDFSRPETGWIVSFPCDFFRGSESVVE